MSYKYQKTSHRAHSLQVTRSQGVEVKAAFFCPRGPHPCVIAVLDLWSSGRGFVSSWVAIKWLLLRRVAVWGQVNHICILLTPKSTQLSTLWG